VYTSNREAPLGLFWQRADGSGAADRLTVYEPGDRWQSADTPTRDGQTFLYTAGGAGDSSIWAYSLRDRKASRIIDDPGDQTNSVLSPDGRWVAYQSDERANASAVYVQPFPPTGAKFLVTQAGNHPLWSPDGSELFFMNNVNNGQLFSVSIRAQPSLTFGVPVALAVKGMAQAVGSERHFDITPDGKRFAVVLPPGADTTSASQTPQPQIQVVLNWFEELKQRAPVK
jgi:hypothetical protein